MLASSPAPSPDLAPFPTFTFAHVPYIIPAPAPNFTPALAPAPNPVMLRTHNDNISLCNFVKTKNIFQLL